MANPVPILQQSLLTRIAADAYFTGVITVLGEGISEDPSTSPPTSFDAMLNDELQTVAGAGIVVGIPRIEWSFAGDQSAEHIIEASVVIFVEEAAAKNVTGKTVDEAAWEIVDALIEYQPATWSAPIGIRSNVLEWGPRRLLNITFGMQLGITS